MCEAIEDAGYWDRVQGFGDPQITSEQPFSASDGYNLRRRPELTATELSDVIGQLTAQADVLDDGSHSAQLERVNKAIGFWSGALIVQ